MTSWQQATGWPAMSTTTSEAGREQTSEGMRRVPPPPSTPQVLLPQQATRRKRPVYTLSEELVAAVEPPQSGAPSGSSLSSTSALLADLTARLESLAAFPAQPELSSSPSHSLAVPSSFQLPHTPKSETSNSASPTSNSSPLSYRTNRPSRRRRSPSPHDRSRPLGTENSRGRTREPKVLWESDLQRGGVDDELLSGMRGRGRRDMSDHARL
ncbi:hypothetical protein P7C70_g7546, partial [Phenoliferia sp. Uapishka_3]